MTVWLQCTWTSSFQGHRWLPFTDSWELSVRIAFLTPQSPHWRDISNKIPNIHIPHYLHLEGSKSLLASPDQDHKKKNKIKRKRKWKRKSSALWVFKFQKYLNSQMGAWIPWPKRRGEELVYKCKIRSISRIHHPDKILPTKAKGSVLLSQS